MPATARPCARACAACTPSPSGTRSEQCLFLARDPFGIKPLYVHDGGKALRFASQVKALLAGGAIAADAEPAGVVGYWVWGHVPEPWTLHRGIRSLEPGTWLRQHEDGRREAGTFESVERILSGGTMDGDPRTPATLREALLDSVRHHLVADVPVGVFLSSGIDSATLAALAAECGTSLRTVTLGFEEYRGTASDEAPLAERVARQYGARHETVWIRRQDFEDGLHDFLDAMDQPSIDGLNTWLVARAATGLGLKVAISGLGGDEIFAGYPSFRQVPAIHALARPFAAMPGLGRVARKASAPLLRRLVSEKFAGLLEYGTTWEGAYQLRRATRMPWELEQVPNLDSGTLAIGLERLREGQYPDRHWQDLGAPQAIVSCLETTRYMRNQLLRDADWAGMAHSLEIRVPLVDAPLARHVASHNAAGGRYTKQDLAACANPPLPGELVQRTKTGFTVPVREWMLEADAASPPERGARGWQAAVARAFIH